MTPLKIAVAGLGRMGVVHALHVHELARDTKACELVAVADLDPNRAHSFLAAIGRPEVAAFSSVDELAKAGICDATVLVTPTGHHRDDASVLIAAGHRVMLEKPLTGTLAGDREFAAQLDKEHPNSLMLAFQRRFDPALAYAKELASSGTVGEVFKIYSALEDSSPIPNGYVSGGILADMSVHSVDEILWFTNRMPTRALAVGSNVYSHKLTTTPEDFDDALLSMWFGADLLAQVQVTRNHVSGYRVETIVFGDQGHIHVGHFDGNPLEVTVEAYGKRGRAEPLAKKTFHGRDYGRPVPEFVDRFGSAYKAELVAFIECCKANKPFPSTHREGLRAQEVISAAMNATYGADQAAVVGAK